MKYHDVLPIAREEAEVKFQSTDPRDVADALVRSVFHDPDKEYVLKLCVHFAKHHNVGIRSLAATCLGHYARIHGEVDFRVVLPVIRELLGEPETFGTALDAIDDIIIFVLGVVPENGDRDE
jgi:hypothetical protein